MLQGMSSHKRHHLYRSTAAAWMPYAQAFAARMQVRAMGPIDWDDLASSGGQPCLLRQRSGARREGGRYYRRQTPEVAGGRLERVPVRATRGRLRSYGTGEAFARVRERMRRGRTRLPNVAHRLRVAPEGTVRISAPPTLARYVLAPSLPSLAQRQPVCRSNLMSSRQRPRRALGGRHRRAPRTAPGGERYRARAQDRTDGLRTVRPPTTDATAWNRLSASLFASPEAQWVERELSGYGPSSARQRSGRHSPSRGIGIGACRVARTHGDGVATIVQQGPAVLHREVWLLRHPELGMTQLVQAVCDWLVELARERLTCCLFPDRFELENSSYE